MASALPKSSASTTATARSSSTGANVAPPISRSGRSRCVGDLVPLLVMVRARLQDVLSATYLVDLEHRPIEEIRTLRAECQQLEVDQSYLRRLVQGRLD